MKLLLVLTLFIHALTYCPLLGQKIVWGEECKYSAANFFVTHQLEALTAGTDGIYLKCSQDLGYYSFEKFDVNFKLKEKTVVATLPKYKEVHKEIEKVFDFNGETYAIMFARRNGPLPEDNYLLEKFNKDSMRYEFQQVLSHFQYENQTERHYAYFSVSPDEQNFLCTEVYQSGTTKTLKYSFTAYDKDFKVSWKKTALVNQKDHESGRNFTGFAISNSSDAFAVNQIVKNTSELEYYYSTIAVFGKGETVKIYDMGVKEKVYISRRNKLFLFLNNEGDLIVSGFYADKKADEEEKIQGNYYAKIDSKTMELELEQFNPFTTKDYKVVYKTKSHTPDFVKSEFYSTSDEDDYYFADDSRLVADDGSIYQVLGYETGYWRIKNLRIHKISVEGKIEWIRELPIDGNSRIKCNIHNNKLHVLFNDHLKNGELEFGEKLSEIPRKKAMKNGCLVDVIISEGGSTERKIISTYEQITGGVEKFLFLNKDRNLLLLYGVNSTETKKYLGTISFD